MYASEKSYHNGFINWKTKSGKWKIKELLLHFPFSIVLVIFSPACKISPKFVAEIRPSKDFEKSTI
jgi:hypothetical protein